jgi:photosystem II stability/assembly factor-like uncharacterized protein
MARRHLFYSLFVIVLIVASAGIPVESRGSAALQDQGQEKKLTAGRNVNMVSGTTLPNGDPWLQRQNEPSMAVSTRNPLHILAGSNDYRTVDMPIENEQLPGREGPLAAAPDAWLGLYKSVDGGQSWASTLLPGFPQDTSSQGTASPLKYTPTKKRGFTAAADPVVRSGASGMFYYSGIAFNRTKIPGWVNGALFISRYIDKNDAEAGDAIQYIDTQVIADDSRLAAVFIDKPWIAVDAPLPGAPLINIKGQMIPRHDVYIAYSVFVEAAGTQTSSIIFRRSPDCGKTWGLPHILSLGSTLNQGATIAVDPRDNGNVYVAWRRFDAKKQTSAIMVSRSRTRGILFEGARVVSTFPSTQGPFDQPSTTAAEYPYGTSFRTNSYPTMAVDEKGIVYLAWTQRGYGPARESRIVLATSSDGLGWSPRAPIDSRPGVQGHQFMPSLAFAAGKLTMAWYDQRDDYGGLAFGFDDWISESLPFRHTIDVRAAQADTADYPNLVWETTQISRYHFTLEADHYNQGKYKAFQSQWNPPNYQLFSTGTLSFHGDYLDVAASPAFVRSADGRWRFNTAASDNALFHVTWTDNRDVRPPSDGNWANYAPPTSQQLTQYITPGRPVCTGGQQPGMRNQNVYTAQLFSGIEVGSPTNAKALDLDVPRAFAVFVKNNTWEMRSFRLTIAAQPPNGQASFLQFDLLEFLDVTIAPYSTISRQVFINSTDPKASVLVRIEEIDAPDGTVLPDGMTGSVLLNGDPASSGVVGGEETHQPQIENPHIRNWSVNTMAVNPEIDNEDIVNTDIVNPNIVDLDSVNPVLINPNVVDPSFFNPHIRNTDPANPNFVNPHIRNPHIRNESPEDLSVTDVEWPVKNAGNTASSFTFTLLAKEALPEGLYAQLIVYKVHTTPAVAGEALAEAMGKDINSCELKQEPHHEILLNIVNPDLVNPHIRNPNLLNPHIRNAAIENATFVLGPGEEAIVNLRIIESHEAQTTKAMTTLQGFELPVDVGSFIESVGAAVTAQSVDSEDAEQGIEEPKTDATALVITTSALPPGTIGLAYPQPPYVIDQARIQAVGGTEPYAWWVNPDELPPGLTFSAASGQISGAPLKEIGKTYPRVYSFTVQVTDSGSPQQSANQRFSIAIEDPTVPPPPLTITTASPLPTGTEGTSYGTALNAVGGIWPYTWTRVSGSLPPGLNVDELGTIGGTPSLAGTYTFLVRVTDSGAPVQFQEKEYSLAIRAADAPTFSISGRVTLGAGGPSLPGVLMRGLPSVPTTDASGSYSDTVPAGWSGTATPFKAGYYFVPAEISYTNVQSHRLGQNYVAYPVTLDHFDISNIADTIAGVPFSVTITAKDSSGVTVTTYTDANILSDTTGTISPTMTGPFANGVWTGQVFIRKTASDVVIQTTGGGRTGQSNSFDVALGAPSAIRIEDAPGGTGTEVVTKTLGPGHSLTVYAVSRDLGNNFTGNVPVVWSLADKTGGIVDTDLVPAGDNMSAVFTAHAAGTARIHAQHASLGADTTGTIRVMETQVDDPYEDNDDFVHAAPLPLGTHADLVLMDPDWFKITVSPADAGKDLMIHLQGVSYPDPDIRRDLDMIVLGSDRMWGYNISGGDNEYAFIPGVAAGDYYIGQTYIPAEGIVYSLTAEVGTNFGLGYIEGRLTTSSGYGLANILVELYGEPFNWDISRPMTTTDANGYYRIGYFPGKYTVRFNVYNPDPQQEPLVADSSYLGKTYNSNEVLTLLAGATVPGIDAQLEPGGIIWGRVTDSSGNGLSMARVYIHASDGTTVAYDYTNVLGNYVADRIPTGNYKVRVRHDATYGQEWYGEAPSLAAGMPVPVMGGQVTSGIDVVLGPDMAYLQGRVTDNLGNPIPGVTVSAFDEAGINVSSANTDAAGNYLIPRLSTGEVRIYFNASPAQGNYVSKYFPNEDLLTGAIPIPVKVGETTSGIDAQLSNGGTITGRVTDAQGNGIPGISVRCFDTNSDRLYGATTVVTGNYTLANVRPDDYKVLFRPETGSLAAEWHNDRSSSSGARIVTVGAGQVVSAIDAQLAAIGGSISGRVIAEIPVNNVRVLAYDSTRGTLGAHIASALTDEAGNYRIPRLPGTSFKVYFDADRNFLGYNSEYYAGKGTFGQADIVPVILGEETANIFASPIERTPVEITATSLPEGRQSTFYSASLEASGGRPFYYWSLESGALPNGLTLNGKGEIRGNPTAAGTFTFTVRVTDSTRLQWFETQSDTQEFTITIGAYTGMGYVISGKVFYSGYGLSGVVMDGLPGSPVTNAQGEYNATVSSGWSGMVTPTLAGYAFGPPNRTYANVTVNLPNQDYLASPGVTISGTITLNGTPLPGVLMAGLPGEPRTNSSGVYSVVVPTGSTGWTGTVTPTLPGFTFNPPTRDYTDVTTPQTAQDYTATYAGGADDAFEENDTYETAAVITPGTYENLVMGMEEDWFKVYVPASEAGKIMRVHIKGVSYPVPTRRYNLDFRIIDESRKLLSKTVSSGDDEYAYILDLTEGWYFIGLPTSISTSYRGLVYSLSVDIGTDFGLGFIEGKVMDEEGAGIEGVYVALQGDPYDAYISRPMILTKAGGTYKIAWTPGNYAVNFNSYDWNHQDPWAPDLNYIGEAYNPIPSPPIPIAAGSTVSGIDIRLTAGGIVTGRITDAAGIGLNGVSIGLYDSLPLNFYGGSTNLDGSFSIDRIRTGNYKIRLWPRNSDMARGIGLAWFEDGKNFDEASPVHVQSGQTTPDINARLGLEPGGYIEGTVTDNTGAPLPLASVQANDVTVILNGFTRIFPVTLLTTTTDASGHYRLGALPQGSVKIGFTSPSGQNKAAEYLPEPVTVMAGQTTYGIDAQLGEGGTISGQVTDAAGNPLGNINIAAIDTDSDRYYVTTTDAAGNYTLSQVSPDDYKVICYPLRGNLAAEWYDNQGDYSQGAVVTVGAGQNVQGIDIRLEDNGAIITGQVTGGGIPLKNIMVMARDIVNGLRYFSSTYTDMAGNYTLRGLPTGQVKLQFVTCWNFGFQPFGMEYYDNKSAFELADPISTVRGETISNLNVQLDPYPALTISTPSLPNGEMAIPYEIQLQASGGKPFLSWSLESGVLPNGLTLKGNGVISGIPTATGTFNFTARVVDTTLMPQSTSRAYSITIGAYSGMGHLVSGRIMAGGSPVPGIVLDGLPGSPATSYLGEYIAVVPPGWSGTVTPTRAGYAFDPPNRIYTNVTAALQNQDFTATAGATISGTITLNGTPLPGVLMVGLPGGPRTNSSGVYSGAVPTGWSGSVTPTVPGFSFNPPSRDYTNVTTPQAAQDFTATYAAGADDRFEDNDSYETAAVITPGTYNDLVGGADEDWYKVYVSSSDTEKIMRVHAKGVSYPNPTRRYNLGFGVIRGSGKYLSATVSSSDDEYAFIPDLVEGWYFIRLPRPNSVNRGIVYSLSVDIGADFGLGFITGKVMDEGGNGIEGIYVELRGDPYDAYVSRPMVLSGAEGAYKIAWTPGNYTVNFNAYDWDHGDPWAPDMNYIGDAYDPGRSMPLIAGTTVSGIDIRLAAGGIVTGRVTDAAGNGLYGIYVGLYDSLPLNEYGIDTDPDGFFSIDHILTGNYKIFFQSWEPEIPSVWFENGRSFDEAIPVHVQGGETTPEINARLGLEPGGYIEGTVTDSTGAPLPSASVQANDVAVVPNGFTRIFPVTLLSTTTDASGHYRLGPLPGGFIKIAFNPSSLNMVGEHYPDMLMFKDAEPVTVTAGQTTYGIDAQLAEAGTISGRVTDAAGNPLGNINIGAIDTDSDRYYVATTDAAGNYTLSRVSPDDYKVICYPLRGNLAAEWFDDQGAYPQGSVVAVGAGQNVPGIDFRIEDNGAIITGQVTGGGVPLKNVMVVARDIVNGLRYFSMTYTDMAGNYTLRGLPTGQVKLQFVTNWVYAFLPYGMEYYNNKGAYEIANPIATVRGETTSGINVVLDPYPALTISTTSLPNGEMAIPYEIHLQASGGKPFHYWSLESGALPNGLTFKGNGVISGVPTATGTFNFMASVIDATLMPQSTSRAYSITIGAYTGLGHTISGRVMAEGPMPLAGVVLDGLPGNPATNILGEYVAVVPPGWSGTVSPFLGGYSFAPPSRTYTNLTSSLAGEDYAASVSSTLYVSTGGVPSGRTGSSYGYTMVAQGGTPSYSWTVASGHLPAGLTLNTGGQINGTPTEGGEFPWTVRVADSSSPPLSATRSFSLIINPAHQGSWTTTYPLGGQVNPMGLVFDPSNPARMYAVLWNRGIYRSTDGGASWMNFTETAAADSGTWFDARYLNVFLIGSASQFYMAGNWGLFRSLNQGANWTRMDTGLSGEVISMALDPANGNIIYAGTREGKVYSSTNGGTSWSDMSAGLPATEIRFLAVDPADTSKIHAGTGSNGIYRSVGGGAWISINGIWADDQTSTQLTRVETIILEPQGPGIPTRIFIAANDSVRGDGIFKTADGGATWSILTPQMGIRWQPGYYIAPNPTDPGGIFAVNGGNIRIYSGDGTGYSDHYVADNSLTCLAVDPVTLALYAGTDRDGVFKGANGGTTWTAVNNNIRAQSFPNFDPHTLHLDAHNPDIIYAGSFGGGFRSLDGGDSWTRMEHPDWWNSAFATHAGLPAGTVFSIGDRVNKSETYGSSGSWTDPLDPAFGTFWGFWDRDIVIVPSAPNVLYAGVYGPDSGIEGVWKSLDGGARWEPKNNGLTDTRINALSVHPSNPAVLFASTRLNDPTQMGFNTRLFRTDDGGDSWEQVTCGLPDTFGVTQVVFAPSSPDIIYLCATGWNRGLYKSTDGGSCWAKLNSYNITAVAVHPANPDIVFIGFFGSPGFYVSFNGGQTWTQFNAGLHPNPWVDSIVLDPRNPFHVFIGTNAGVYETTLTVDMVISTTALPNAIINQPYSATLKAAGGTPPYAWSLPSPGSLPFEIAIETATGTLNGQPNTPGSFALEVKVVDSNSRSFTRTLSLNVLALYPLEVNINPSGGGSVTRNPDLPLYPHGTIVGISAAPNAGYAFIGWSGGISGTNPAELVAMVEGKSIQANFALTSALPDYHVSSASFPATAAAGEIISGSVNITIGNLGSGAVNPPSVSAGIYLSKDGLITPEDTLLWKGRVFFVPPGSGETLALPIDPGLQIPTTIAAGGYTIGVLVDDAAAVVEGNEDNNGFAQAITISATGFSHLELLGGWPYGTTVGVDADVSRQVALRGHGGVMEVVDIADPAHPRVISQLKLGLGSINAIKIAGNLAYIAGGTTFFITDISDLHNPQVIGSCGGLLSTIRDFDISGNYAYVSDYHYGLRVIDISTPTAPAVVGSLPLPDCRTRLVKAFGNMVYVTRHTHVTRPYGIGGLSIVDASDHANPVERSFLQNLSVGDLAIDKTGQYLFLFMNIGLKIYDISNPAGPVEAASYGGSYTAAGIKIVGDRAYLSDGYQNRVFVLDVTNPLSPVEISAYQFLDATSICRPGMAGNLCLVPSWYDSLRIVDFSNLGSPALLASMETVGIMYYADAANGYAYVPTIRNTANALKILNIADLSNITETASLATPYGPDDVVMNGIHAYLTDSASGLHLIDVADAAHPVETGIITSVPRAQDIVISGNYAYVADGYGGLKIFDIRTPDKPALVGACPTPDTAFQLAVSGRYAYVACNAQGLRVVDISDPRNPHIVGSRVFSEAAYNVAVWENHAYVLNTTGDILWVVDVADPANPVEETTRPVYYCFGDIGFSGHYMFVPNTFFGLKVFDIANPGNPIEIAIDRRLGSACEVIVRENLIYVVDRDGGFYALEFRNPLFTETFESSPVGSIPSGWSVLYSGEGIATSPTRAYEGGKSLYIRGSPYNGASLVKSVSGLGISSGVYRLAFSMSADPINWTGDDGVTLGHLEIGGYIYAMGIRKVAGLYKLCLAGATEKTVDFPGSVSALNRYEVVIDLDSRTADFYFNGTKVGSNTPESGSASDRTGLAAGDAGPGGGCPTAYYDLVTLEKIR